MRTLYQLEHTGQYKNPYKRKRERVWELSAVMLQERLKI